MDNCIFCQLLSTGRAKEVYRDSKMAAVLDINPWVKGHTLVMPIEHQPVLPLIPKPTFAHIFGTLPKLAGAINSAMLAAGSNLLIANGGAAGQQSPHFLMHLLPRGQGDMIFNFDMKGATPTSPDTAAQLRKWLSQALTSISNEGNSLFGDSTMQCSFAEQGAAQGHMVMKVKAESLESLAPDTSVQLFNLASLCATAQFETLGAQGTNIIARSGTTDDGKGLELHIVPRKEGDGLNYSLRPMNTKPNLDDVQKQISDKTFLLKEQKEETIEVINLDGDEVGDAIRRLQNG